YGLMDLLEKITAWRNMCALEKKMVTEGYMKPKNNPTQIIMLDDLSYTDSPLHHYLFWIFLHKYLKLNTLYLSSCNEPEVFCISPIVHFTSLKHLSLDAKVDDSEPFKIMTQLMTLRIICLSKFDTSAVSNLVNLSQLHF
ncbi:MAG: hypothetical protein K2X98_06140, partial [Alphaproteobacteria bacterium]|nr:hypothetical protein [Alphaproteobacteria bacterium]